MQEFDFIKDFFINLKCSSCHNFFDENSIQLVRKESNNMVIKIICSHCDQNLGLAMLSIDKSEYKKNYELINTNNEQEQNNVPIATNKKEEDIISYEDVLQAHKFIQSLGNDWKKHLPKAD